MADGEVRAQDLAQETASTLSGNEQFVMFDSTAGKRADIDDVATYVAGDKTTLKTTNKTSPVAAINENFDAIADAKEDITVLQSLFIYPPENLFLTALARTEGKFTTPDGSTADNASWGYIEIRVSDIPKLSIAGGRHMTCFYNGSVASQVISGGADVTTNEVRDVPDGATGVRISFLLSNNNNMAVVDSNTIVTVTDIANAKYKPSDLLEIPIGEFQKVITVSPTDNLRTVLEGITDASETNKYLIALSAGTYDISSYYTAAEKSENNFYGLFVPPWCTLYGVGGYENVILQWIESSNKGKLATINLYLNSGIENVSVYAEHLRYAVHDDWVPTGYSYQNVATYTRKVKNCYIDNKYAVVGAYGAGFKSGSVWDFENCTFKARSNTAPPFYMHNNNAFIQSVDVYFRNCRFIANASNTPYAMKFMSLNLNSNVINKIHLIGCGKNYGRVLLGEDDPSNYGSGIKIKLDGYANTFGNTDVDIVNTDGLDYSSYVNLI